MLMIGLGVCCLLSVSTNLLHHDTFVHHAPDTPMARAMMEFKQRRKSRNKNNKMMMVHGMEQELSQQQRIDKTTSTTTTSLIAGLQCQQYGGPFTSKEAEEMVYWRDIPSDELFVSPLKKNSNGNARKQYLTFEPDGGR
jgi:hypothetical protein